MHIRRYHLQSVDSTNSYAKRMLSDIAKDTLHVVVSDTQTAGRGRGGAKSWHAPVGNVYITFAFHTRGHLPHIYSQMAALCIDQLLKSFSIQGELKWPNDVLVKGKKIAGILVEVQGSSIFVGIGLNVNMDISDLEKIPKPATSMFHETLTSYSVQEIEKQLTLLFSTALQNPFSSSEYLSKLQWMIGKTFSFTQGTGEIIGFDNEGRAQVKFPNHTIQTLTTIQDGQ